MVNGAIRKDKLSIYRAGAEQLLNYTDKLGRRDFVLNDTEYSAFVVNSFSGISMQMVRADGIDESEVVGNIWYNFCEPTLEMMNTIDKDLFIDGSEVDELRSGATELMSRNFVVRMNIDENGGHIVFKCLGRVLDLATTEVYDVPHFSLKLLPDTFEIVQVAEVRDSVHKLLGISSADLMNKSVWDFIINDEKQYFKNFFNECMSKDSLPLLINFKLANKNKKPFTVTLNAAVMKGKLKVKPEVSHCNTRFINLHPYVIENISLHIIYVGPRCQYVLIMHLSFDYCSLFYYEIMSMPLKGGQLFNTKEL